MKNINKILYAVAFLGLGAGFLTSCDKDKDIEYKPANPEGQEVFFASNAKTKYQVSADATSTQIPVWRSNTNGSLTVPVSIEELFDGVASPFAFESNAVFADGEKEGYVTVTYDPSVLEFDEKWQYELSIDPDYTTPYGISTLEISIYLPSPWTTLVDDEGEPILVEYWDYFFGFVVSVEFAQNDVDPYLFRISNPYAVQDPLTGEFVFQMDGVDFDRDPDNYFSYKILQEGDTFDVDIFGDIASVTAESSNLIGYQPWYTFTYSGTEYYYLLPAPFEGFSWKYNYYEGNIDLEMNGVQLPGMVVISPIIINEGLGGVNWWDTSEDEYFLIVMPGYNPKDTSLEVVYEGMLTTDKGMYALGEVTIGSDLTSVKVGVAPGNDIDGIADEIDNGTLDSVEIYADQEVRVPFDSNNPNGQYTMVAVGYIDGEMVSSEGVTFNYYASNYDPNEGWTSLGYVDYTDGYMVALFPIYPDYEELTTYSVEIQESEDYPGLYRLVNPYGEVYPLNEPGDYSSGYYYLYIDATDPNMVYIPTTYQALDWGYGQMITSSFAGWIIENGYAPDEVNDILHQLEYFDGNAFGTLADGKITFEPFALLNGFDGDEYFYNGNVVIVDYDANDYPIYLEENGELVAPFCVDLSSLSSQPSARSASPASRSGSMKSAQWFKGTKNKVSKKNLPKLTSKKTFKNTKPQKHFVK